MSFVKKTIKKSWNFVKDNWKTIAIVAAIAFTAGVASVGFAAFAGVSSVGGFFGAVGSTMWAGVAATAGSMGIGAGAVAPAGSAAAAAGASHVGLGAAWGAGSGFGMGVAGNAAMAEAASAVGTAATAETAGGMAVTLPAQGNAALAGMTEAELATVGVDAASGELIAAGGGAGGGGAGGEAAKQLAAEAGEKGLSDAAWKTLQVGIPAAGIAMQAFGQDPKWDDTPYWAVDEKTGYGMDGPGQFAAADDASGAVAGAEDPGAGMMANQFQRSTNPMQRQGGQGLMDMDYAPTKYDASRAV